MTGLTPHPLYTVHTVVLLVAIAVYSLVTVWFDHRQRRIPNAVTVPMFLLGWIYQLAFAGWAGLADGALGFVVGFGSLLVLWLIGAAGGGDVKLLGGLSVWLGWRLTYEVLIASVGFVILGTIISLALTLVRRGPEQLKQQHLATGGSRKPRKERRVMAYAIPVALATWAVLVFHWPLVS